MRSDSLLWLPSSVAALFSAVTWGGWVATQEPALLVLAIVVQLVAGTAMALMTSRERRALALAVAVTVPILGVLAVGWIDAIRGEGGAELLADLAPPRVRMDGAEISRRLNSSLPPCEAIVSSNLDARRATMAHLVSRAAADDISILRWTRNHNDPELAVDAALALEDIGQRFEQTVIAARDAALAQRSFANHAAVVRAICNGITIGLVDTAMIGRLAAEARVHYAAAIALEPASAVALAAARARIELAARCPAAALAVLKAVVGTSADEEILELYTEAAYATRRFDLVPGIERPKARDVAA